ncbi:MAG: hypothetical protein WCY41_04780, partial [Candidatus Micrarchaeia archaeon]
MFCNEPNAYRKVFAFALFMAIFVGMASAHVNMHFPLVAGANTNVSPINFNFTPIGEADSTFNCALYVDGGLIISNESSANDTITILPWTAAEGTHTWNISCVGATDVFSEVGTALIYDITPPAFSSFTVPSSSTDFFRNGSSITFTGGVTDALSGIADGASCNPVMSISGPGTDFTGYINYTNNTTNLCTGTIVINSTESGPSGSGAKNLNFTVSDRAGNAASASKQFIIDNLVPSVVISRPASNNTYSSGTVAAVISDEPVLGMDAVNYTNVSFYNYTDGTLVNSSVSFGNGTKSIFVGVPNDVYNITVITYDKAGNNNTIWFSNITVVPAPSVVSASIYSNNTINASLAKAGDKVSLNVTYSENISEGTVVATLGGSSAVLSVVTVGNTSYTYSWVLNAQPEGVLSFNISNYTSAYGLVGNDATSTTDSSSVLYDKTAPTCSIYSLSNLSSSAYVNASTATVYYKNTSGASFRAIVNATDATGVNNVTFAAISGFTNMSSLGQASAPYSLNYTWASGSTTGLQTVTCYDNAGNSNTTNYTLALAMPTVTISFAEPDTFYSPVDGNNIINVRVNVTSAVPVALVSLNFSNVTSGCGAESSTVNATYNSTSGLYEGSCNVNSAALISDFVGGALVVTTTDAVSSANVSAYGGIVLYNMTTPLSPDPCMQFNASETTNFSNELNFSAINLRLSILRNGSASCNNGTAAPWGNSTKKVAFFNFTSVNLSTQAQAAKLQNLSTAINVSVAPPKAYSDSRIYVNSTYFAELNTTTSITLYDLPFSSASNITADAGAAGVNGTPTWSDAFFDASYNTSTCNLTFTVNGFSGYNATDNTTPTVSVISPTVGQNVSSTTVTVRATLNGTGTEISAASFRINGSLVGEYNSTANTANCSASSNGSEIYSCTFTTVLSEGSHSLNVTAYDFGAPAPGNMGSSVVNFTVDLAPVVSVQVPIPNAVLANGSNTTLLNFTAADAVSGLNTSSCAYSLNGTRMPIATCANGTLLNFTTDGVKTLTVFAKDIAGNEGNTTVSFMVNTAGSNSTILNTTTNAASNETIYVTPTSPSSSIIMGANATNVSLNMTAYNSTSFNVALPGINVTANTTLGNVTMSIPNGTVASGASDWNGTLQLPMVKAISALTPTAASGYTNTVTSAVEIGVANYAVNLSKGVRILIPGKAGQLVGFQRGSTFTAITNACGVDSQAWADANITTGSDCKISVGSDMVVWTKHFTLFGTYTQAANGGGSSGGSSNGGGSSGSGGSSGATSLKQSSIVNVDVGLGKTCPVAITREMASATNLSTLTTTLENTGGSDCSMTDFVFADTILSDFPALNTIVFNPAYASQSGWEVTFSFPTFASGESKTLTYSANQWIKTSLAKNFTAYTMTAKKQVAATQPSTNVTQPQAGEEETSTWIPRKLPTTPQEQQQPAVQPPTTPAKQDGALGPLLVTVAIVAVVIIGLAGLV